MDSKVYRWDFSKGTLIDIFDMGNIYIKKIKWLIYILKLKSFI